MKNTSRDVVDIITIHHGLPDATKRATHKHRGCGTTKEQCS